jgi:hypothetical protein
MLEERKREIWKNKLNESYVPTNVFSHSTQALFDIAKKGVKHTTGYTVFLD